MNKKLTQTQLCVVSVFALTLALTSPAFAQCPGGVCRVPAQNSYAVRTAAPAAPCAQAYSYSCQARTCGQFQPFGGFFRNLFGFRTNSYSCGTACTQTRPATAPASCQTCSGATCLADPVGRENAPDATTDKEFATGGYLVDRTTGKKYAFDPGDESVPPAWKEVDAESCEECEECQECEECEPCEAVETTELESRLIKVANAIRGRARNFLTVDRNLLSWARLNSSRQASYCRLGHFTGHSFEIAGEGYATPEAAINGWLGSAPHREILLNRHFTKVGASVYRGRNGRLYWTMTFGY